MGKFSLMVLTSVAVAGLAGAANAQDMTQFTTRTMAAPWAAPNEEAGHQLNPSTGDSAQFATLTSKPRQEVSTFSTASEDEGLNPGFPSAGQTAPMSDVPEAGTSFSVGSFGRPRSTPAPAGTPPEPRSLDQTVTVTLGFETASAGDRSQGMTPNTVRLGQ